MTYSPGHDDIFIEQAEKVALSLGYHYTDDVCEYGGILQNAHRALCEKPLFLRRRETVLQVYGNSQSSQRYQVVREAVGRKDIHDAFFVMLEILESNIDLNECRHFRGSPYEVNAFKSMFRSRYEALRKSRLDILNRTNKVRHNEERSILELVRTALRIFSSTHEYIADLTTTYRQNDKGKDIPFYASVSPRDIFFKLSSQETKRIRRICRHFGFSHVGYAAAFVLDLLFSVDIRFARLISPVLSLEPFISNTGFISHYNQKASHVYRNLQPELYRFHPDGRTPANYGLDRFFLERGLRCNEGGVRLGRGSTNQVPC